MKQAVFAFVGMVATAFAAPALAGSLNPWGTEAPNPYGTDLLPGYYCTADGADRIGIKILDPAASADSDTVPPDVMVDLEGREHPAQTAYSYFGSVQAPPPHFTLGIILMDENQADGILAFKDGQRHWLSYKDKTYNPCP